MSNSGKMVWVAAGLLIMSPAAHADLVISAKRTVNMNCTGGVCSATAADARLNAADLAGMLASGNVAVVAGPQAQDIEIDAAVTWASGRRLTLDAYRSLSVDAPVVATGTGALAIVTNDGGQNGDFRFSEGGYAQFWDLSSRLVINGRTYVLVGDIHSLASAVAAQSKGAYALAADYDATPDGTYSAVPVAGEFKGIFEGLGNSISNLRILDKTNKRDTYDGLFAWTNTKSVIRDVNLPRIDASGGINGSVGGVVGLNQGQIMHVKVDGKIVGPPGAGMIGGITGMNFGGILDASFHGNTSGEANMGGIVGWSYGSATVVACSSSGEVDSVYDGGGAQNFIGGLIGANEGLIDASHSTSTVGGNTPDSGYGGLAGLNFGLVSKSFATGSVTFKKDAGYVSGLVGDNHGEIDQSFSTGAASGGSYVRAGGIAGENDQGGLVIRSYATGSATAKNHGYVGGLVGNNDDIDTGLVVSSYSLGRVAGLYQTWVGGFVGYDAPGDLKSSYWDMDTSGISDPSDGVGNIAGDTGVTGLTDSALKSSLPSGFDPAIWGQSPTVNNGYPYLLANPPLQ